jgi:hypothetical protein
MSGLTLAELGLTSEAASTLPVEHAQMLAATLDRATGLVGGFLDGPSAHSAVNAAVSQREISQIDTPVSLDNCSIA